MKSVKYFKQLMRMKNLGIFAASSAKTNLVALVCVAFFVAINTAIDAADIRLSNSNGCCALKPVIVFAETERDSLSSFLYFNFSFMAKTMKKASKANNSNLTSAPTGAKSVPQTAHNRLKSHTDTLERFIESHGFKQLFRHFKANPSKRNLWLYSLNKAYDEFLAESQKGFLCAEYRFMNKIKAAKELFPEDKQAAITAYDKKKGVRNV